MHATIIGHQLPHAVPLLTHRCPSSHWCVTSDLPWPCVGSKSNLLIDDATTDGEAEEEAEEKEEAEGEEERKAKPAASPLNIRCVE